MYEVAICDDSYADAAILSEKIKQHKKYGANIRIHPYTSGAELLQAMESLKFMLIFMDVCMENADGVETAIEVRKRDENVILVYITGQAEPSVRAISAEPFRFMKKDMTEAELSHNIEDALRKMEQTAELPVIRAKAGKKEIWLALNEIVYLDKYVKSVRVHVTGQALKRHAIETSLKGQTDIRVGDKLGNLYQTLKPYGFGCPHDSYLINFRYMLSSVGNEIKLVDYEDITFRVARSKMSEFNQLKKEFCRSKYRG